MPAIALGLAATLLGCGSAAPNERIDRSDAPKQSAEAPSPEPGGEPSTEPTADAEPKPVVFPSCDELVTPQEAIATLGPGFVNLAGSPNAIEFFFDGMGPAARTAIDQASRQEFCHYGMPNSDGSSSFLVAELPVEARDNFLVSLRSSDFAETTLDGSPVFVWRDPTAHLGPGFRWYGFSGRILVAGHVLNPESGFADLALTRMKAANPTHA